MTSVFEAEDFDNHEVVHFVNDKKTGLKAIIALHSTHLGPAGGGIRMQPYENSQAALKDVLRLSKGMSYKNALAGIELGGGKSVIIGNPKTDKSPELFHAFGQAIADLGGKYIAAEDVGTTLKDMEYISQKTKYVFGRDPKDGFGGDPSPMTAYGVFLSLKESVKHKVGAADLKGIKVAVQGAGAVGKNLIKQLVEAGAKVCFTDVDVDRIAAVQNEFGAEFVALDDIISADVDVFAPCALGAVLNDTSIPQLKAKVVCGAANNQLAKDVHGVKLVEHDILYAPDYVANAAGIINVFYEIDGQYDVKKVMAHIEKIPHTLSEIFKIADETGQPTALVADEMARNKIGR